MNMMFCRIMRFLASKFGKYVEVDTPTLQYRAYVWRGRIYIII